jgi:hypothetical protein
MPRGRATTNDPFESKIEVALDPGHFIKHSAGWSFVEGLENIEQKIAELLPRSPGRAVALYETFLAGCYEKAAEVGDSGASFGMFVARLFRGWVKARQASHADADETARRLVAWIDDDPHAFCYQLERELVPVLDKPGLAAFERRIRERFDGAATVAVRSGDVGQERTYVRRRAAEILRAIRAKQRNVAAYVAVCEATELTAADCVALARMFQARRKPAEALAWVERGFALAKQPAWSSHEHELGKLARDLLVKLGRDDAALDAAWGEYKAHPHIYSYTDLMRYVPKAKRAVWHDKAMKVAATADLEAAIELWIATREIDRLVDRLRKARDEELEGTSHHATELVANDLAKSHPAVAAKLYRALAMRILKAKNSRHYDAALANLGEARRCYERAGLGAKWNSLVREVRAEHHRKTGFMAEFEGLVAGGGVATQPAFLERGKARWSTSGT